MKKNAPFTTQELRVIKSLFGLVAKKHKVTRTYVYMLATGERSTNSKKARTIINKLKKINEALSPIVA